MIEIIPAIDIINGQCVRLKQGDFSLQTQYGLDPLEVAKDFESRGYKSLHVVDLDAAKGQGDDNRELIMKLVKNVNLSVDVGGGLRSQQQIEELLASGVLAVNVGSIAVQQPEMFFTWVEIFGAQRVWLSADVRQQFIAVSGWQETTQLNIFDWLRDFVDNGLETAVVTSIERDGMLSGPDVELYQSLTKAFPTLNIVGSGGVSSANDFPSLEKAGVKQVIVGKALFEKPNLFNQY